MTFYEIPYAEGVTFVSRTAQVFPDTAAGTVAGRATYRLENASGRGAERLLWRQPGLHRLQRQGQREDASFTVSDYQEYNEARLEVTIPERGGGGSWTMEYSGFPRRASPPCRGARSSAASTLCLENSAPRASCDECHARRVGLSRDD